MKIFRDPIHNVIDLDTGDKAANALIIQLIDSMEFQRLRYIRQLGFAYFAYPSAMHTRFEHSLGVAFLAKRFVEKVVSMRDRILGYHTESANLGKLEHFFTQISKDKPIIIIAALLHDIGHGPLSHVFEHVTQYKHEDWTQAIILGDTDINRLLTDYHPDYPQAVCELLCASGAPSSKIIAGQLDIDKIDYILRDSYMTGAGYGKFDVEWLFNVLTVGIYKDQVEIGLDLGKGLSVAEDFIMARIYMFRNIYLHKTSVAAQTMLELLLCELRRLPFAEKYFPSESLKNALLDNAASLYDYVNITDDDVFALLKCLRTAKEEMVSRLARGLLERRLLKKGTAEAGTKKVMTYQADKDYILLFDKSGQGFPLHEKSKIIPAEVFEVHQI
ncbi:MAG: HD domain-containing protein [Defluviitaleaceae bacterium]|nr:HD domain-containing protein [Defluviitaleaceae bacterium]